jgi:hypothetical protein
MRQEIDHEKHTKLLDSVSSAQFPAQQYHFINHRREGTGTWFLNSFEFEQWLNLPHRTLFCRRMPGAEKTMIAATAIDYLLKVAESTSIGVAYVILQLQDADGVQYCLSTSNYTQILV